MFVPDRELGSFLLDARLLSRADLDHWLARVTPEESLYSLLLKGGSVPEDELRRAAARVLGIPFGPVMHEEISTEALMLVPEPVARAYSLAAFAQGNSELRVMLLDTDALPALEFLEREQMLTLVPQLTDRASIKRALLMQQKFLKEKYASRFTSQESDTVLDGLLSHALLSRASEIHLDPEDSRLSVRYRIGGSLHPAMAIAAQVRSLVSALKELAKLSFTLTVPQEGKFKTTLKNGERVAVRVASLPSSRGEKITLHLHREHSAKKGFTFSSLGLHGETLEALLRAISHTSGLIIIAGPQGGGKTTLTYTLLDYLASPALSVVSVEEEIETQLPLITQVAVRRDLGQTTLSSVRAALLHRPDILAVGDVRDDDTARLCASAASRGMLVIAGVEAEDAEAGVQKFLDWNIPEALLNKTLRASVGTRVVKKICPDCKEEYHLARAEAAPLEASADFGKVLAALKAEGVVEEGKPWKEILFSRAVGCSKCEGGYRGSIGLQEIKEVEEMPLNIIEDGLFKAAQGITSIEEVRGLTF